MKVKKNPAKVTKRLKFLKSLKKGLASAFSITLFLKPFSGVVKKVFYPPNSAKDNKDGGYPGVSPTLQKLFFYKPTGYSTS
jgi:hypothetical protein